MSRLSVLLIAIAVLLLPIIWIEVEVLQYTHGTLAYPLDDTFIHMAVAKNLAFEKVWGISKYSFQSASSSPLYTVMLATSFLVMGAHLLIPLIINLIAAIYFLVVLQRWLIHQGLSSINQLVILIVVILLTPLPLLVICGMEHTLQLLFCFLFIYSFAENAATRRIPWYVYLYGSLMVTTRYETMSMVGIACLFLLLQRRWWQAIKLGAISLLPIILFGIFAMSKGSYFMPNSVLLKSGVPPLTIEGLGTFFTYIFWYKLFFVAEDYNILSAQRLLLLLPLVYLLFWDTIRRNATYRYILVILMGATLAHVSFAYYSPFPRYEAYLVGCSVVVICVLVFKHGKEIFYQRAKGAEWVAYSIMAILALPLVFRSTTTFGNAEQDCINIYEQQYQMAQFVHTYYDKAPVAFNDIGAVSYYSEGDKLDLIGIASLEVIKSKKMGYWSPAFADSLSRRQGIQLAILYDKWFAPKLLHKWKKVASWQIQNNLIAGDAVVSFYAVDTTNANPLRENLHAYQKQLPAGVLVRYY